MENQDDMKAFLENISELVFVVCEANGGAFTAIEGNLGLIAMGDSEESLHTAIREQVNTFFKGRFSGIVRVRTFTDTVLSTTPRP